MIPLPDKDSMSSAIAVGVTDEDVAYGTLFESHPILESFVSKFDLVCVQTGERFSGTATKAVNTHQWPTVTGGYYTELVLLAYHILSPDEDYSKNDIIEAIRKETNLCKREAAKRFKMMVDSGVLTPGSLVGSHCMLDSTMF